MPRGLINVPLNRLNAATAGQLLGIYPEAIMSAANVTGFFAGPISLPEWVDTTYFSRIFIYPRGGNPAVAGQAIQWELSVLRILTDATTFNQTNTFTYAPSATWSGTDPRVEIVDDNTPTDPLYAAGFFAQGDSIGWLLNRNGPAAGDSYTFAVSVGSYLEFDVQRRCQKICC